MSNRFQQSLDPLPFADLTDWQYHAHDLDPESAWEGDAEWKPGGRTLLWDDDVRVVWFRQRWTVPAELAGTALELEFVTRSSMKLYVDGEQVVFPGGALLTRSAEAGREYRFLLRVDRHRRPGMIMRSRVKAYPAAYAGWFDALMSVGDANPGRGLLIERWHHGKETDGVSLAAPEVDHSSWPLFPLGEEWREENSCYWYRARVQVPDAIGGHATAGQALRLTASFNGRGSVVGRWRAACRVRPQFRRRRRQ